MSELEGMRGCLSFLIFGWIQLVASINARSFGRHHAVVGTEVAHLLPRLKSAIVMDRAGGGIVAIILPVREERLIRRPGPGHLSLSPSIHAVSGPDSLGRIAYVENLMSVPPDRSQHRLRVIHLVGTQDQVLFTRAGDALWQTVIGDDLALSPVDGKIAFISGLTKLQMHQPPALLQTGTLEVWDVDGGSGRETGITALDDRLSWFPDGRHLAYVALTPNTSTDAGPLEPDGFGGDTRGWPQIPAVFMLDTETNETEFLHLGRAPVASTDGKTILVADGSSHWRLVEVASHRSRPVQAPGQWGSPLALIDSRLVLYRGLPTAGTRIRLTGGNSPLRGPKLMLTLKVADLDTAEFQTVVPYFDSRTSVSFGPAVYGQSLHESHE